MVQGRDDVDCHLPFCTARQKTSLISNAEDVVLARAQVGPVAREKPIFTDETTALLHRRLKAVGIVLVVTMSAAFVGNFAVNAPLIPLRTCVLLLLVASYIVLKCRPKLRLVHLRIIEMLIFGAIVIQVSLMMYFRTYELALKDKPTSVIALKYLYQNAWSILILVYGIFVPNTWKRATLVLLPLACVPYVVAMILTWQVEEAAAAFASIDRLSPIPLPFVAVLVAVVGTHIINSFRLQEFQARQLGQYHVKEQIGSGGMGDVYKAEHRMLKRPCAIKLIRAESETDEAELARFEREVRSTAKLSHWNTVEIFDYGHTEDGTFYYVMELLPGLTLQDLVERHGPLPAPRAVHFLRQTCRALREAHGIGLIHRDIKPANIFAAHCGGIYDVAKLLDFGLVRQTVEELGEDASGGVAGKFRGSPLYMAPEQVIHFDRADQRADIYALGCVAYYIVTGQAPFPAGNSFKIIQDHASSDVTPPSRIEPSVPADLEEVVLRCLAKDPQDRCQDARMLEQALSECECAGAWTDERASDWWVQHEPHSSVFD
jgi:tRNA A-37 threonylcarbamoyl transferase component Bud32